MLESLNRIAGPNYASALLWTFAALIFLVIVLVIVRLIRSMTFGTFVVGGRNRKTRLAVMDATAVDSHRRLVLIRRDDIEHLILIGGPTDVVVERDIRLIQTRRPGPSGNLAQGQRPSSAPRRPQASSSQPQPISRHEPPVTKPPIAANPTIMPPIQHNNIAVEGKTEPYKPLQSDPIDDTLMSELEVSLDALSVPEPITPVKAQPSLDDEMARLLGELSSHKKQK